MSEDIAFVTCPYCFESMEIWLDPDSSGSMVQDCEVCCNPWDVYISRDEEGFPSVDVRRSQ